jgi:toxic protein SymE
VFGFEVRFVMNIRKAQRTGIKMVFIRRCRAGNHRAIKLRVVSDRDIKAAFPRVNPALLHDRVVLAAHFILAEAGFESGTPLKVRVMPGCLVLTAQELPPAPPPEPEIMQTLRKVCKLSARTQRQVEAFIQTITAPQPRSGN